MTRVLVGDMLIGDRLMTTPAIRVLKETYPVDLVTIVIPRKDKNPQVSVSEPLLQGNPYISGIYHDMIPLAEGDMTINMDSMAAYVWACSHLKTISQGFGHLCGVDVPDTELQYDYFPTDEELEIGKRIVDELGEGKPVVAIARHSASCSSNDPKIGWANKCLPNFIWVEVAQWLTKEGFVPVAVGAEREVKDVRYRQWPGKRLYGEEIRNVAGFLSHCQAVLSVDTGIRHLAAAVGTGLYCLSGTINLSQIRCEPIKRGQKIFEEYCPLQDASAKKVIEGAMKVL